MRGSVDPKFDLDDVEKRLLFLPDIEFQFLNHAFHSLVAAPTKLLLILLINTRNTQIYTPD
jgi:hypothetical protein